MRSDDVDDDDAQMGLARVRPCAAGSCLWETRLLMR